ncbi:MAG: hypothetical protein U9N52_07910 [Campylobacterota bacterium]|nr:hypothetical protein [Campylobacterota bacterium]
MKCKKIILSALTAATLVTPLMADPNATYIPFTNDKYDKAWILFGVNAFATGLPTTVSTTAQATFTPGYTEVEEADVSDEESTGGFLGSDGVTAHSFASFQALQDSGGNDYFTALTMGLKTNDLAWSETEAVRSMYISIEGAPTVSKIKLDYKAQLEGRTVELQLNGVTSVLYSTTISSEAVFTAPAIATTVVDDENTNTTLAKVDDVIAYELSNSPVLPEAYSKADHQGTAVGDMRFYNYDAVSDRWLVWDRLKTGTIANDFSDFTKGKGYWGRFNFDDSNTDNNNSVSKRAGLYLGKTNKSIADESVYANELAAGWNMISFDPAQHPDIRNSATGLIVQITNLGGDESFSILDETGVNKVDINLTSTQQNDTNLTLFVNQQIEHNKILGNVPWSFNVKAFPNGNDGNVTFLSDKAFTLKDTSADILGLATTLTKQLKPLEADTLEEAATVSVEVDTNGIISRYGEYVLLLEPLVGTGTAAELDNNLSQGGDAQSAKVQLGDADGDSKTTGGKNAPIALAANDTTTTIASFMALLVADPIFDSTDTISDSNYKAGKGYVSSIDLDQNGTADTIIAASTTPFYIRDNTYTRVYTVDTADTTTGGKAFKIVNSVTGTFTPDNNTTVDSVVDLMNTLADKGVTATDTETYAAKVDTTKVVLVTADKRVFQLQDTEDATLDYFKKSSTIDKIGKGAIKRVFNTADLAREIITINSFDINVSSAGSGDTSDNNLSVNGSYVGAFDLNSSGNDDSDFIGVFKTIVDKFNTVMKDQNISAFASHNYTDGTGDASKAIITIQGVGVTSATLDLNGTSAPIAVDASGVASDTATNPGKVQIDGAAIVSDLKDNAVYTPDYVGYGPLYTLKEAGFEAQRVVKASTAMVATPTTHWDHIDVTRDVDTWLDQNEFNLFNVDNRSGYWVYLDEYVDPQEIALGTVTYTPEFQYHFNPTSDDKDTTTNIIAGGEFTAVIAGLDPKTSNVNIIVGGKNILLTKEGDVFAARLTEYETDGLTPNPGAPIDIGLRASNGIGEAFSSASVATIDYDEPAKPTVTFYNGVEATFESTSSDVASYYLYKDFISDTGKSPVEAALPVADAAAYNMCNSFTYGEATNLKVIAVDGSGVLSKANASDPKSFKYYNLLYNATVLEHTYGDELSNATSYNSACEIETTNTRAVTDSTGVNIESLSADTTVRISYAKIDGLSVDNTTDIPLTTFYTSTSGGSAVIKLQSIPAYNGKDFFVEYKGAMYKGSFPADSDTADNSFSSPISLTITTMANSNLKEPGSTSGE